MGIVAFNPNRQAIHVAGREYILDLNLRPDGTGIARLSEVDPGGRPTFLSASLRYDPGQAWVISTPRGAGSGRTAREAAVQALSPSWARGMGRQAQAGAAETDGQALAMRRTDAGSSGRAEWMER